MGFGVDLYVGDGFSVLSFSGQLDSTAAPQARDAAIEVLHTVRGRRHLLVIDGSGLEFLDSTGIGVLIGAHRRLLADNGGLLLANLAPTVARAVTLTGLDTVIPTHTSADPSYPWLTPDATVVSIATALGFPLRAGWPAPTRDARGMPAARESERTVAPPVEGNESPSQPNGRS